MFLEFTKLQFRARVAELQATSGKDAPIDKLYAQLECSSSLFVSCSPCTYPVTVQKHTTKLYVGAEICAPNCDAKK